MQRSKSGFSRERAAQYAQMLSRLTPKSDLARGCVRAFWVGGVICVLGQALIEIGTRALHLTLTQASGAASIALVFLTALLTGVGVFDKIGQYAGAGAVVPITGFANAMVSPAMEFKPEGWVLGIGAKLFSIAGAVIAYGVSASVVAGVIYYFATLS